MTDESLLSDQLVRDLVAVGQVDILVGVPTLNNAATIADLVRTVQGGCATYLPRARTVLLNSDGGSQDGTPGIVQQASGDETGMLTTGHRLRTSHRITVPYHGPPGKGSALHLILSAADLLQAHVVVVLDADVTSITPEWVPALVAPVRAGTVDFTAPLYARHPLESPLLTQLVTPLVRAVLGRRVREGLGGEFACSTRVAGHLVEHIPWKTDVTQQAIDACVLVSILASDFRVAQAALGPRLLATTRPLPPLSQLFRDIVGTVLTVLEQHAPAWLQRTAPEDVPIVGTPGARLDGAPHPDLKAMLAAFSRDVGDLRPILAEILRPETLDAVAASAGRPNAVPGLSDPTWAATVFEFLLAHHRSVMRREHVTQALMPLYLGRTATFLRDYAAEEPAAIEAGLERLSLAFEDARARLVERWTTNT